MAAKRALYRELCVGRWAATLSRRRVSVLAGLIEQQPLVRRFLAAYLAGAGPRVALCGINPGRFGGGKTGLPFLDFHTLRELLPGIDRDDRERSAGFVAQVIGLFGAQRFFAGAYLTNVAAFGFVRDGCNLNHDALPRPLQRRLFADFADECALLRPRLIVPLGQGVAADLARLRRAGMLDAPVAPPLPHPRYAAFPSRVAPALRQYRQVLAPWLEPDSASRGGRRPRSKSNLEQP